MPRRVYSEETKAEAVRLARNEHLSLEQIAAQLGIRDLNRVSKWAVAAGVRRRRQSWRRDLAVQRVVKDGQTVKEVSGQLGVTVRSVKRWVADYLARCPQPPDHQDEQLRTLREANRLLQEEVERLRAENLRLRRRRKTPA